MKFNRETGDNIRLVTGEDGVVQTGVAEIDEMMTRLGVSKIENVFAEGGTFRERRREAGLHLWYDVYAGDTQDHAETRAMGVFGDLPFINAVELIPVYRQEQSPVEKYINQSYSLAPEAQETWQAPKEEAETPYYPFNDPGLSLQWHYQNFGNKSGSIAGADINLFPAWEITAGRPEVIVAVIDGGVDYSHPDLAANMWVNTAERNGTAGVDDDGNGYKDDVYGYRWGGSLFPDSGEILPLDHGTHCAGTIAAVNNNGIGCCGVAGGTGKGDGVRIMSCQTFVPDNSKTDAYGNTIATGNTADAFAYAADNGAVIVSCSFSSTSNSYKEAIDYFIKNAGTDKNGKQTGPMKGGVVVCAAGNESSDTKRYPAAYEPCISVGGIRWDYTKASGSNYGDWITLSAPYGGGGTDNAIYSTYPTKSPNGTPKSSGYGYKSGTSQACPHVAGIAALMVSKFGVSQPDYVPNKLVTRLANSTRNIDSYLGSYAGRLGVGLVDAGRAVNYPPEMVPEKGREIYLEAFENVRINLNEYFSDPDGDALNYEVTGGNGGKLKVELEGTILVLTTISAGHSDVKIKATDLTGESVTATFAILAMDPKSEADVYPNPVTDILQVRMGKEVNGEVGVQLFNSAGVKVLDTKITVRPSKPGTIAVEKLSGGIYTLVIKYNGKEIKKNILKY
ncbi:Thermophilic serine proteinase [termite gut metagenome]|uniref:Thermophilic serine proteinase n=1 Tax=termite gut metagenome TaxID=433724 RepID=A0A5J4QQ77_9ZZZZ